MKFCKTCGYAKPCKCLPETDKPSLPVDKMVRVNSKYGYCPYCTRYIGSGYIATEHKKICKNVSPDRTKFDSRIENTYIMDVRNDSTFERVLKIKLIN